MTRGDEQKIIEDARAFIQERFQKESSGHDWWHIFRVWKLARYIGQEEAAKPFVVELAALLHDIADWKFHGGDCLVGPRHAVQWLKTRGVPPNVTDQVSKIITEISFKGALVNDLPYQSLESRVVQDADRLDALGAIGIARTFAYGGFKGQPVYDPREKPRFHDCAQEYLRSETHTINHFYEKLLLLKNRMKTRTGRDLAESRHQYMENFLNQFYQEWNLEFLP